MIIISKPFQNIFPARVVKDRPNGALLVKKTFSPVNFVKLQDYDIDQRITKIL
jgi:hypothetical protein